MNSEIQTYRTSYNEELKISTEEIIFKNSWETRVCSQPVGIRYGVTAMDVYHLRLCYNNKIQLLTEKEKIITISLKSYLGIRESKNFAQFNSIIDHLWESHFNKLYEKLVNDYSQGIDLTFDGKYIISGEGLNIVSRGDFIPFNEMQIEERVDHFIVNSKKDPKLYTNIYFLKTWNAVMIYSLLESITTELSQ